ncbi:hypothetical protein SY88_18865 [Clostridiales bacterium PH28_bin88]|nr:hypothetical protein SY88_18865 [Clostridiales bacterium PH28_bin88]
MIFVFFNPGDLGKRDYWELARTLDELSSRFIVAFFARDQAALDQLVAPGQAANLTGFREGLQVTHLHQQTVLYEDGEYNSIMQVGTADGEPFSYAHVYFRNIAGEWKVSRPTFSRKGRLAGTTTGRETTSDMWKRSMACLP